MKTLGEKIKTLRKQKKLTQEELGKKIGVTKSSVSQWESGDTKKMNGENLVRIAEALGVNAKWLSTGEGSMEPKLTIALYSPIESQNALTVAEQAMKYTSPKVRALIEELIIKTSSNALQDDDIKLLQDMTDKLSKK